MYLNLIDKSLVTSQFCHFIIFYNFFLYFFIIQFILIRSRLKMTFFVIYTAIIFISGGPVKYVNIVL